MPILVENFRVSKFKLKLNDFLRGVWLKIDKSSGTKESLSTLQSLLDISKSSKLLFDLSMLLVYL